MEDHLRLVSVVYENDVNITALGDPSGPLSHDCGFFSILSLRYGSLAYLDGLVFALEPMTTQTQGARLSHNRGEYLVFPGIQPLW